MLRALNKHSRDKHIFFDEPTHKYTTRAVKDLTSVTTFIKKFFNEFDADEVISKMQRFGAFDKKYPGMTAQEVKDSWKEKGRMAAQTGTRLHKYIEMYMNGVVEKDIEAIDVEIEMFHKWIATLSDKYTPFRTEWIIYDEDLKIAGTIDMLFRVDARDSRKVAIFDWKCSKEIKYKNKYERARAPLGHLEDCNYVHYSLQLNLYKYLLEKNYGLEVQEMNLIVIHRSNDEVQVIPVSDHQRDIQSMFLSNKCHTSHTTISPSHP